MFHIFLGLNDFVMIVGVNPWRRCFFGELKHWIRMASGRVWQDLMVLFCVSMTELQEIKLIALYINRYKTRLKTYGRETTNHRNLKM